jgi:hypothetical protein
MADGSMQLRSVGSAVAAAIVGGALGGLGFLFVASHDEPVATHIVRGDRIIVTLHVALENRAAVPHHYTVTLAEPRDAILRSPTVRWRVGAGGSMTVPVLFETPRGARTAYVRVDDDRGSQRVFAVALGQP